MIALSFLIYVAAGLAGVVLHWYNRYWQGRTTSSFVEYMAVNRSSTVSSCINVFVTSAGIFGASPPEVSFMMLMTALTAGYMGDSVLNRDKTKEEGGK